MAARPVRPRRCAVVLGFCLIAHLPGSSASAVELTPLEEGTAAQLTTLGNMELGQGRYETAIQLFQRALQADRAYFFARYNLALAHQLLGRTDEARTWYQAALKISPNHPDTLCNLGYLAFQSGDFATAASTFQDAARLAAHQGGDAAQYWYNAGTAREALKEWSEAGRAYQEALALDANHYGARYNLGTLYLGGLADQPGALEKAELHLKTATGIDPHRPEAWLNLAQVHALSGKADPLEAFDQALAAASGPHAKLLNQVRWQRARYFQHAQPPQPVAMREELKRILADDPTFPGANGQFGAYLYAVGDYDGALAHLEREVAKGDAADGRTLDAHFLLAVIYAEHRIDPAKAIAHATAYYQARPDSPKIHELRRRALRLAAAAGVSAQGELAAPSDAARGATTPAGGHGTPGHRESGHEAPAHAAPGHDEPATAPDESAAAAPHHGHH